MLRPILFGIITSILFVFCVVFILSYSDALYDGNYSPILPALIAGISLIIALFCMVLFGIPIHFLFQKFGFRGLIWYFFAGFIPGSIFILIVKPFGYDSTSDVLVQILVFGLIGSLVIKTGHQKTSN